MEFESYPSTVETPSSLLGTRTPLCSTLSSMLFPTLSYVCLPLTTPLQTYQDIQIGVAQAPVKSLLLPLGASAPETFFVPFKGGVSVPFKAVELLQSCPAGHIYEPHQLGAVHTNRFACGVGK